ncbi:Floral homeotic protein [Ancistrocladus abbreviatus]
MARGKIQIKRIENSTNRQVTYSKRRNGLFKKANELTVLCDAKVSIIMFSSTNKLHEFISPSTNTKEIYDLYQKALGVDIWSTHYARMQEDLKKLKDINRMLQREIRRRMGDCLDDMGIEELQCLEQDVENAVKVIRERKYKVISNQIDTHKKKSRNLEEIHRGLLQELVSMDARDDPRYGLVDNGAEYEHVLGFPHGGPSILALRLQPSDPNLHSGAGSCLTTYTLLE